MCEPHSHTRPAPGSCAPSASAARRRQLHQWAPCRSFPVFAVPEFGPEQDPRGSRDTSLFTLIPFPPATQLDSTLQPSLPLVRTRRLKSVPGNVDRAMPATHAPARSVLRVAITPPGNPPLQKEEDSQGPGEGSTTGWRRPESRKACEQIPLPTHVLYRKYTSCTNINASPLRFQLLLGKDLLPFLTAPETPG